MMTSTEVARGYLAGSEGVLTPAIDTDTSPRQVLERVLARSLSRPPCGVAFSGGRDSSLLLAVATHVARRDGLPDPIPLTRRFPALEEADERDWQELVVRRLGLDDWQRMDFTDELDIVGPIAQRHLRTHGVVWPAAIATSVPLFEAIPGGSLVDGEGGDEVLGDEAHRIAGLNWLLRGGRQGLRRRSRAALAAVAPRWLRRRHVQRERAARPWAWLRPDARDEFVTALTRDRVERPLSWAASVRAMPLRRAQSKASQNRAILARAAGVELSSPLLDPEFVHAMARDGGFRGRGDRAAVLRHLAAGLLPEEVFTRRTKATFNRAYISTYSCRFAEEWSGTGVDLDLVDPDGLRATWLGQPAHWMSAALLQQAWLAALPSPAP